MIETPPPPNTVATVRLSGQVIESNAVPVEVLIRALSGMQQLIYIMASDNENKKLSQRFRVSREIEQNFKLVCKVPQPGSYAMPLALERPGPRQLTLPAFTDAAEKTFTKLQMFFESLTSDEMDATTRIFSDRTFAQKALQEVRRILPNADDSWNFGFLRPGSQQEIVLTKDTLKRVDDWLMSEQPIESITTITGELIRIDFDEHKLYLRYPPTHQLIECIYSDELEDTMIENRRDYIQVTGVFTLDSAGNPVKLTDVTRIEPLDLAPVVLIEVRNKKRVLRFNKALEFVPELAESKQLMIVNDDSGLGISAFAHTREELVGEISAQMFHLFDEYASCDDDKLTAEAIELKIKVRAIMGEVDAS